MVYTAAVCMVAFLIANQLGLLQRMAEIAAEVAACPTCAVMWGTFAVLVISGGAFIPSLALSFAAAYVSKWAQLTLIEITNFYNDLWERLNADGKRRHRTR